MKNGFESHTPSWISVHHPKNLKWHKDSIKQPEPLNFHSQATTFEAIHRFWSLINDSECQCAQPAPNTALTFSSFCLAVPTLNNYFSRVEAQLGTCCAAGGQGPVGPPRTCQGWSLDGQTRWGCSGVKWGFAPTLHRVGMGGSLLHSKGLSPAVRAFTLMKSRAIFSPLHPGWVISGDAAALTSRDTALPTTGCRSSPSPCAGNETSMAFLSHFWRSPAPFLFLFRAWTMCRTVDIDCSCELGFCPLLVQWKNTDFSHSFLCKASTCPRVNAKSGPQKQCNDRIKTSNSS